VAVKWPWNGNIAPTLDSEGDLEVPLSTWENTVHLHWRLAFQTMGTSNPIFMALIITVLDG
jgi:hypothetical protein